MGRGRDRHVSYGSWLVTGSATLTVAFLVAFHAVLLWQRVLNHSLLDPGPALRWLVAAAVVAGWLRLRRQGVSLLRGRSALVCWLLVLLLHLSFWGPADSTLLTEDRRGAALLLVLPAAVVGAGLLFKRLRGKLVRSSRSVGVPEPHPVGRRIALPSWVLWAGFLPSIASRPPPAG